MDARIEIIKKESETVGGRPGFTETSYYICWATPLDLYGNELYSAQSIGYKNTINFKVRYCNKIKEMRKDARKFIVRYDGLDYDIYSIDFKGNAKDFVYIKANAVI